MTSTSLSEDTVILAGIKQDCQSKSGQLRSRHKEPVRRLPMSGLWGWSPLNLLAESRRIFNHSGFLVFHLSGMSHGLVTVPKMEKKEFKVLGSLSGGSSGERPRQYGMEPRQKGVEATTEEWDQL